MSDFIEIERLPKGKTKASKITISKKHIIAIRPDGEKTKITLMQLEYSSSVVIICPMPYEQFIAQYKILE